MDDDEDEEDEGVAQNHADDEGFEEMPHSYAAKPHDHRFHEPTEKHAEPVTVSEPRNGAARCVSERMERPPEELPTHPSEEQSEQSASDHVEIL